MPLVQEDLRQIKGIFETLIAEKIAASVLANKESPEESSVSSVSDREVFQELKNQRDLIEKILHQIDKRFEQVDKRFEEMREDMNKRFEEQREDMNRRFEEQREDMNRRFEQVDKRFEQVDKRFEEMRENNNKRFQQLFWFIGLFMPLCNSLLFIAISYLLK